MRKNALFMIIFVTILTFSSGILLLVRKESSKTIKTSLLKQWDRKFIKTDLKKSFVVSRKNHHQLTVLSESQGYGMLIAANEGLEKIHPIQAKKQFQQLDNYYLANRYGRTNLMSWKQVIYFKKHKLKKFKNNATDGDLYLAYSLIQAAKAWPQNAASYRRQAKLILQDILKYDYNPQDGLLTVGNWATSDKKARNLLRTSDVLPKQFTAFYHLTGNRIWLKIKQRMLATLLALSQQHKTGLLPDFAWVNSKEPVAVAPKTVSSKYDGAYYYNACRLPYNLAQSSDSQSQRILNKMMKFFMQKKYISGGYHLNGQKLNDYQSASFGAPIFYAALNNQKYNKLIQQEKYIFMQKLMSNNYYQSALIVLTLFNPNFK
ncbi:glycosyl hydrolase family 8 [Liquorilactobacillus sicerae]|uniref:glycosyl hydrolase family 8 n=1 Tax=Liquorilactobacillus sicerae TaxID=1416943 RepID=UPI00247FB328|nr:glycosyl hydrolase family 8 [Liquorilactobacillus sicerae]